MIIDRYLAKQVTQTLVGVTLVLLLIFISGQLVNLFGKVAAGTIHVNTVMILLGLNSISNLVFVLPLSFYLAILLALTRLHRDNEMIVLAACGIGQGRVLSGLFLLIIVFAVTVGVLSMQLAPWAQATAQRLVKDFEQSSDIQGIIPGRFKELTKGVGVIYVESLTDDGRLHNIFLQREDRDEQIIVHAEMAYPYIDEKSGERYMILENGSRYAGVPGTENFSTIRFERHGIIMQEVANQKAIQLRYKAIPTKILWNSNEKHHNAELQWRISAPLLCVLLAILAVPLSRTSNRQGRYSKLALAILIYILYTNTLNVSRAWISKGEIDVSIGMWWVHGVILVLALLLWMQQAGKLRWRRRRLG